MDRHGVDVQLLSLTAPGVQMFDADTATSLAIGKEERRRGRMWRLDFMAAPGARAAGRTNQLKPSEYFQRKFAITTNGVEDSLALRYCIDRLGADNIMWAIDYPYQPTAPAVAFIESAPMSEDHRKKIAYMNAERVFRITAGG